MTTYFRSNRFLLFVPIIVVMVIACNNKTDEKATEKKDTTTDTTISTAQTTQPKSAFTDVTLDVLYTDATSFKNLPNRRIFFVLTYIKPDISTLSGWSTSGGDFSDPPDITLKKSTQMIIIQDTTYVGNVKLSGNEVQQVKANIAATHAAYVLFIPTPSPTYRNHIEYAIGYTNDDPAVSKNPSLLPTATNVIANPSPPKTAN